MKSHKGIKIVVVALVLAGATVIVLGMWLAGYNSRNPVDPAWVQLIDRAILRQAQNERVSVEVVRSINSVEVRYVNNLTCIELRNREISVSSLYCYRHGRFGWVLESERVETR